MWQNRMLLLASYIFYGSWNWRYLSLILISTTVDYLCGLGINETTSKKRRKACVSISIVTNLSLLGVFKYYDFFAESFQVLVGNFGVTIQPYFLNVILPVGISFYTFQTMSYTIDVYRGKVPATKNIFDFALYVSYFPQLIAGPIERGTRLLPQILQERTVTLEKFYRGAYFFFWGLFLKVFMADNLAKMVEPVFGATGPYNGTEVLLATYAFSFQVYCDFAGYSFMAIGLALTMGIELMENFRRPYLSKNISEFWRRWHISLSSWFRDYVFTPFYIYLSKRKYIKKYSLKVRHVLAFLVALFIAEFLLGMWHGAAWSYGLFGIYHGLMIGLYYLIKKYWDRLNDLLQVFLTFQVACLGWLIFRSDSLSQTLEMAQSVFLNFNLNSDPNFMDRVATLIGFTFILAIVQIFQDKYNDTLIVLRMHWVPRSAFLVFLACLTLLFGDFSDKPFIYFQF
jgi:alginate O-acetyltransferase complex protein AlgI